MSGLVCGTAGCSLTQQPAQGVGKAGVIPSNLFPQVREVQKGPGPHTSGNGLCPSLVRSRFLGTEPGPPVPQPTHPDLI
jgi:hypothetical protein